MRDGRVTGVRSPNSRKIKKGFNITHSNFSLKNKKGVLMPDKRKPIPKHIRQKVYEKYCGHCAYCGCKLEYKDMQVDHINPVYWHNGSDDIENFNPSCRMCNFYKSTYTVEKFRERIESLHERLEKIFIYRLARKFGIIQERSEPIVFFFEK